ncbi:arginase [Shimia sp. FJ5]|uniref:arginase n=1 Tax=Shimia sp. FJ5 TaxID=3079054 RepID=UPI002606D0F3|nr:arginase [Shimia sp. FJ5]MDV4145668.1 arginase [Shimia sp. FJ5]
MTTKPIHLIGVPMDCGKRRRGCLMGPDAYRTAGLSESLIDLGHTVTDTGNVQPGAFAPEAKDTHLHALNETVAWTRALQKSAEAAMADGLPIFMGGDHALSAGTVSGVAAHAAREGRPQFMLWLDAHTDFHTPGSTDSGNLHGTPVAYISGQKGFDAFPPLPAAVPEENICLLGLRSVDRAERAAIEKTGIHAHDMREIDEHGIARPLAAFLDRVAAAKGMLHVSLDVDFLDPDVAPAVGTTVPGGATVREAHLVMEMLYDSGLMTSLDLVELNPFLDTRGRTAKLMVDLAASALGRNIFDRVTRSYS